MARNVLFLIAIIVLPLSALAIEDTEVVLKEAFAHLQAPGTIKFDAEMSQEVDGKRGDAPMRFSMALSGGRYRFESRTSGKTSVHDIATFDGKQYQVFSPSDASLTVSTQPVRKFESLCPNPLLIPFLFCVDSGSFPSLMKMRNPQISREISRSVIGWRMERVDGDDHVVGAFPREFAGNKYTCDVYFKRNAGFYPIRSVSRDAKGAVVSSTRVIRSQDAVVDGAKILIPIEVEIEDRMDGVRQVTRMSIQPESLCFDCRIPAEEFSIPIGEANTLYDMDQGVQVPIQAKRAKVSNSGSPSNSDADRAK